MCCFIKNLIETLIWSYRNYLMMSFLNSKCHIMAFLKCRAYVGWHLRDLIFYRKKWLKIKEIMEIWRESIYIHKLIILHSWGKLPIYINLKVVESSKSVQKLIIFFLDSSDSLSFALTFFNKDRNLLVTAQFVP